MNETVARLVDAIKSGDALATETAFTDAMAEKLAPKLEDMRINVAQSMFAPQEPVSEEKEDDKEEDDKDSEDDEDDEDKESDDDKEDKEDDKE